MALHTNGFVFPEGTKAPKSVKASKPRKRYMGKSTAKMLTLSSMAGKRSWPKSCKFLSGTKR